MKQTSTVCVVIALCVFYAQVREATQNDVKYIDMMWYNIDRGLYNNISGPVLEQVLDVYAPVSEAVENQVCREHSKFYKQGVKDKEVWALYMLDAGSKVPAGLFKGNVVQLGNYDECLEVGSVDTSSGSFSGQYCMVTMGYHPNPAQATTNVTSTNDTFGQLAFLLGLKWSVCIPSSCTPRDLEVHLQSTLQDVLGDVTVSVGDRACRHRGQTTEVTAGDWFALIFLAIFVLLVVLSTAYDLIMKNSASRSELFASFSLYTNGRKLLGTSPGRDTLQAVYGIRTLAILWVVQGHSYEHVMYDAPAVNGEDIDKHPIILQYRLSVDTFLLLSGLFVSYTFLRDVKSGKPFNLLLYYLHRYIRLTSPYAVMVLLTATIFGNIDDGPLWGETAINEQQNCKVNWWTSLTYLNNYVNALHTCMTQSWYLSVDMQLYWLSPLVLYPIWKWPRFTKALLGALISAGLLTAFLVAFVNQFPLDSDADKLNLMEYLPTHTRFTPWAIGIGLGYVLHTMKGTTPNLSRHLVVGGWLLSLALLIYPIVIGNQEHFFVGIEEEYNRWYESFNSAVTKPAWALGVAWVIFACAKGYGGFINTCLSWNVFQVLSRLTYCVYLVHYAVILWLTGTVRTPMFVSDRTLMMQFIYITAVSFAAALVLSLVFEAPALIIENVLLDRDGARKRRGSRYGINMNEENNPRGEALLDITECDGTDTAAATANIEDEAFVNKGN